MGWFTLGVYPIIWCHRTTRERSSISDRPTGSGGTVAAALLLVALLVVEGWNAYARLAGASSLDAGWGVLFSFGYNLSLVFLMASALAATNQWRKGQGAPRHGSAWHLAFTLLLGVLYAPIAMAVVQAGINRLEPPVWEGAADVAGEVG